MRRDRAELIKLMKFIKIEFSTFQSNFYTAWEICRRKWLPFLISALWNLQSQSLVTPDRDLQTVNNLDSMFKAKALTNNNMPCNLRGSTSLVLPRERTTLYDIDTIRIIGKNTADSAMRNERVPIIRGFHNIYQILQMQIFFQIFNFKLISFSCCFFVILMI